MDATPSQDLRRALERVFVGEERVVTHLLVGLFAAGHVLIEDVPGVGKTTLARALARCIDCRFQRVQFTPDLLPADLLGVSLFDPSKGAFVFRPGPIFTQVLLADEINRTPPRTQSALLEAMSEEQVSVDGETRSLPSPFLVLATMNPSESHGVYELPESQLDRFLLRLHIGYPDRAGERTILRAQREESPLEDLPTILTAHQVSELQAATRRVRVTDAIEDYVLDLVAATRTHPEVELGASPRASLALVRAAQAHAIVSGRDYCVPDDVLELLAPVLAHRLVLRSSGDIALGQQVIGEITEQIAVPS